MSVKRSICRDLTTATYLYNDGDNMMDLFVIMYIESGFSINVNMAAGIRYIDWVNETHQLDGFAAIDITEKTPMSEIRPPHIKLNLFPQQRVELHALREAEKRNIEGVPTILPDLYINGGYPFSKNKKVGTYHSDQWGIKLKVGSGKTLICYSLVGSSRVPMTKRVILGCDIGHSTMMYADPRAIPRMNLELADLAIDLPCYFDTPEVTFPSYKPCTISHVQPKIVWPLNLYFVADHLVRQMREYCEEQVTYPWICCDTVRDVYEFIIDVIVNCDKLKFPIPTEATAAAPLETLIPFDDPSSIKLMTAEESIKAMRTKLIDAWLVIIPVKVLTTADYHDLRDVIDEAKKENAYDKTILTRLNRMSKLLTTKDYSTLELIRLVSFIDGERSINFFSRVFYDDYDSLPITKAGRIYALKHYFVSGTDIQRSTGDFAFSTKMAGANIMRFASTITVAPEKVTNLMNLSEQVEKTYECTESSSRSLILKMLSAFIDIAKVRSMQIDSIQERVVRESKDGMIDKDVAKKVESADPKDAFKLLEEKFDAFIKEVSAGGFDVATRTARDLDDQLRRYGLSFIPPVVGKITIDLVFSSIYKTFVSQLMYTHLMRLSISAVDEILTNKELKPDMAYIWSTWKNFVEGWCYPLRTAMFADLVKSRFDPNYICNILQLIQMPTGVDQIDQFLVDNIDNAYMICPYLIRFLDTDRNREKYNIMGLVKPSDEMISHPLQSAVEQFKSLEQTLVDCLKISITCVKCGGKISDIGYITTDCNTLLCDRCTITSYTTAGSMVQCSVCGKTYQDGKTILAMPFSCYMSSTYKDLVDTYKKKSDKGEYIHSVYTPYRVTQAMQFSPPGKLASAMVVSEIRSEDKIATIVKIFKDLETKLGRRPIMLLYSEYGTITEDLIKAMHDAKIRSETFSDKRGAAYRRGDVDLIIANNIGGISGYNMEYLDVIIAYSPIVDDGIASQLYGRALRVGRQKERMFHKYTLIYPSEKLVFGKKTLSVEDVEKKRAQAFGLI